jgi:two-component system, NarL family, sensor kinase
MLTDDARPAAGRSPRSSRIWAPVDPLRAKDAKPSNLFELEPIRGSVGQADFDQLLRADGQAFTQEFIDALAPEVAIFDLRGRVVMASKAWQTRAGESDVAVGANPFGANPALDFLTSDESTARLISRKIANVLSGELQEAKLNYTVRNGVAHRRYRLRAAALGTGRSRGAVVVNEDVTEMHELHRDKRLLTEQLMRSEETERRRIAREMHDSTVQDLVAIGLNLKRLRHLANDPVAQEVLAEVRTILTRTQQDVRTLSYLLHPPLLEEGGLVLALASLIRGLSSRMQICVEFESDVPDSPDSRLPIDIEMALYRVAQEALINVHKHASATHAVVHYHREIDRLVLIVEDDGVGISGRNAYHVGSGVGIQGMRARLLQLGGALTLSTLRRGTRVKAVVPIDGAAEA